MVSIYLRRRVASLACFFAVFLLSNSVTAQVTAVLSGRVTDPTGAVISAATVTATSLETGMGRMATTNSEGLYELLALPIGHYQISAKKDGFAEQVRTGIVLVVGQDATVDFRLRVGQVTEQVKVESDTQCW